MIFEEFKAHKLSTGADSVVERTWQPHEIVAQHAHPFDVDALLVQGELWLTHDGSTRHIVPGERYTLPRDVSHDERYGPEGATAWVARKH